MDDVAADVPQQERCNNKCYTSAFRYIYIYIYIVLGEKVREIAKLYKIRRVEEYSNENVQL